MSSNTAQTRPWHLANTTVRNPFRVKKGLEALVSHGFESRMHKDYEERIARVLDEAGVINLRPTTTDVTSISRKWRSVLIKLGFIWPDVKMAKVQGVSQRDISPAFSLTPNGRRLLAAESVQGEQEVLLRSLAALQLPSPLERGYKVETFSPLRLTLRILEALKEAGHESYISRVEMAAFVILANGATPINELVQQIVETRRARTQAEAKRRFDTRTIDTSLSRHSLKNSNTLFDYQDVTFRYLKGTGLFQSRGRGITLVPEKERTAITLAEQAELHLSDFEYLHVIANGATLPTDSLAGASNDLANLREIAEDRNIRFKSAAYDLSTPEGISLARHDLEDQIFKSKEIEFAAQQANEIDEILTYLKILDENMSYLQFGDDTLKIPQDERPAYFEWLLWRVLLALGGLAVPPYKVRRFHIDQDFLPVGTAPGGGADVIGEYSDSVLVVEVTLTENSRQEAAEGEPVRRHVADVLEQFEPDGKTVYGLFVARKIDTNTAETFRIGVWYLKGDVRKTLDIVPLTLSQLREVLERAVAETRLEPSVLFEVIEECSNERVLSVNAPDWKARIGELINV